MTVIVFNIKTYDFFLTVYNDVFHIILNLYFFVFAMETDISLCEAETSF
jgi:hypothetical protein